MDDLRDAPASWPVLETHDLHRGGWVVALREDVVTRPDHPDESFRRTTLEHPGAAVVLAVDDDERVFCLRQYRHPAGRVFVELPAGLRDAGAEPSLEIFLARDLSYVSRGDFALRHEEAEMERLWVPMADLLEAVLDGRVAQGPLVQAVLAYDVLSRRDSL
jgi:8-oxo-dGDP phosphatase